MISKMTPSSKSPVRNPQHPPSLKFRPDLNHVRSSSNFKDNFLIIYWHYSWCQRWPHSPSLQSGPLYILRVLNEASQLSHDGLSSNFQDIFQHDLWCQRWLHPSSPQQGNINLNQAPIQSKTNFKSIFSWAIVIIVVNNHWKLLSYFDFLQPF